MPQQDAAVGVLVRRVGVRKVSADVARADGAEDRIADRMDQYVRVRMTRETAVEWHRDPAEYQTSPGDERVNVETIADA